MANTKSTGRTKSAFADESFFHQVKQGGERGWNDIYIDPKDAATATDRFYIRYYGACIASLEVVEKAGVKQTKITIFGSPSKSPAPAEREISDEEWAQLFDQALEAIQMLYQA